MKCYGKTICMLFFSLLMVVFYGYMIDKAYAAGYNADDAIAYARKWTRNDCPADDTGHNCLSTYYNPAYYSYTRDNGYSRCSDCANFVSQCLHAGGLPFEEGKWDGTYGQRAWCNVSGLINYLEGLGYYGTSSIDRSNIRPGDVLVTTSGWGHVVIVSEVSGSTIKICGHTANRVDSNVGTIYYHVCMNGSHNPYTDCDEYHNIIDSEDGWLNVRETPNGALTGRTAHRDNNPFHIIKKATSNGLEWGYVDGLDGWIALGGNYTQVIQKPAKPSINVSAGDELHEVIMYCDATANTDWYDYRIYDLNDNCIWGKGEVKSTQFAALLPAGTYKANIAAVNGQGLYTFSDLATFTISGTSITGMGTLKGRTIFNGHTYELYDKNVTWLGAKTLASQNGGYLATITSQAEQDVVQALHTKSEGWKWIGAESFVNNTMAWVTGESMSYTNWAAGEPNNSSGIEHCTHLCEDGTWNDVSNNSDDRVNGYIVEYDTVYGDEMNAGYNRVLPDGDYVIAAAADPLYYLDISGSDVPAPEGTNVAIWSLSTGVKDWDAWTIKYSDGFYRISQLGCDRSLDVNNASIKQGENVQVTSGNSSSAQKWAISLNPSQGYRLQAKCSGLSLDIEGGKLENGINVEQWSDNDSIAQRWVFIPYKPAQTLADGRYILVSTLDDSMVLDVAGDTGDVPNETNVDIWNDSCQSKYNSFDVTAQSNGYYTLTHAASGKELTALGGGTLYGSNVAVYEPNDSTAHEWAITKDGDNGGYVLRARSSGYAMDVTDGGTANGTNVRQLPYNGTKAQTWRFVKAEHQVQFIAEGASDVPQAQTKYYHNDMQITDQMPSRSGYRFVGWDTDSDAKKVVFLPGDSYLQDEDLLLYAVWEPFVTGITLDRISARIIKDHTLELIASVIPEDASSAGLIWSSSDTSVADVSENGIVTALKDGTATITVASADGSQSATCAVTVVTPVRLTMSVTKSMWPVVRKSTDILPLLRALSGTMTYSDGSTGDVGYTWEINNPLQYVAKKIPEPLVGTYACVFECLGLQDTLYLTFVEAVTGIELNTNSAEMKRGESVELQAVVSPVGICDDRVHWTSTDSSVAIVNEEGLVTAIGKGRTIITATTEDGGYEATCEVTVLLGSMDRPDFMLPEGLTQIEEEAFEGLPMSVVKCPEGLTSIGQRAFADCKMLRQIYIPESCLRIHKTAFEGCNDLTIFGVSDSVAELFANMYGIEFEALNE